MKKKEIEDINPWDYLPLYKCLLAEEEGFDDIPCDKAYGFAGLFDLFSPSTYAQLKKSGDLANGAVPAPTYSQYYYRTDKKFKELIDKNK